MKLALVDDTVAGMVYLFGGAAEHYDDWHDYTVDKRERLVKEIQSRSPHTGGPQSL